jgi:hypothetical protein
MAKKNKKTRATDVATTVISDAELYGRITALQSVLGEMKKTVGDRLLTQAQQIGIKAYQSPVGAINIVQKDATIAISDMEALAKTLPEGETMLVPRPWAAKQALARLAIQDGDVVDVTTGELVGWAEVVPESAPYVSWPASTQQKAAKQEMASNLAGWMARLSPSVRAIENEVD